MRRDTNAFISIERERHETRISPLCLSSSLNKNKTKLRNKEIYLYICRYITFLIEILSLRLSWEGQQKEDTRTLVGKKD